MTKNNQEICENCKRFYSKCRRKRDYPELVSCVEFTQKPQISLKEIGEQAVKEEVKKELKPFLDKCERVRNKYTPSVQMEDDVILKEVEDECIWVKCNNHEKKLLKIIEYKYWNEIDMNCYSSNEKSIERQKCELIAIRLTREDEHQKCEKKNAIEWRDFFTECGVMENVGVDRKKVIVYKLQAQKKEFAEKIEDFGEDIINLLEIWKDNFKELHPKMIRLIKEHKKEIFGEEIGK